MSSITNDYRIALYLPAPRAVRRAHALEEHVCSLTVESLNTEDSDRLAQLAQRILLARGQLHAVVLGDFGQNVSRMVPGLLSEAREFAGLPLYDIRELTVLHALFRANVERIALFACADSILSDVLRTGIGVEVPWWKFTRNTDLRMLTSIIPLVGIVAVYSPTAMSVEFFSNDLGAVEALNRLRSWKSDSVDVSPGAGDNGVNTA